MKKIGVVVVLFFFTLMMTGCEDTSNYQVIKCTKQATLSDSSTTADLEYQIYYEGDYVKKTISTEMITSSNDNTLEEYKKSYENVFKKYEGIKYYDNTVTMSGNTVTSKTIINYDKVDSKKIIEIEGDDGNIFEDDGKVKLDTLLQVYKKYGSNCDD